jgi:Erv1 / Alr family
MSPNQWGPPTWIFMHTLAEKIKDDNFPHIGKQLIQQIILICRNLPCPDCAQHAKDFWAKVKIHNINTRQDLINLLFVFHNTVNKRKSLRPFKYDDLSYYKTRGVIETFNIFARNFTTRGNMRLINESFHRNMMLANLRTWLMTNISYFELN